MIRMPGARARAATILAAASLLGAAAPLAPALAQAAFDPDTVRAGRFDTGKMWTFEYAPTQYFTDTYGFQATEDWFRRARLAALRIPGCSASFVSPNGLVATNHHCVRGAITQVARQGEDLLDDGFYASAVADERRIPGYYADQLIAIEDVTAEVFAALDAAPTDAERDRARQATFAAIQQRLAGRHGGGAGPVHVEVVGLYHGGRYSAYVFRRYTDVRLVAAAELQAGFFGGDPDNFTYPRHALDFAFLRIYDENGRPLPPESHFTWSRDGADEGDVIFVIGNPGPTSRLTTMAQLQFLRDVQIPAQIAWFEERHGALADYRRAHTEDADRRDFRNLMFSLSNSLKANIGRREALANPLVMAKRADAERAFRRAIADRPELAARYGNAIDSMAAVQRAKGELAGPYAAFLQFGNPTFSASAIRRALAARQWRQAALAGLPADSVAKLAARITAIGDYPAEVERRFLTARLAEIRAGLGDDDPLTRALLQGATPEAAAQRILETSVLADSARAARAVATGGIAPDEPALRLVEAVIPALARFQSSFTRLLAAEAELAQRLGRARFDVYGTTVPPDATFSPRITDGVVQGYPWNGTEAPPHTTFFGMYELYHAFGEGTDWELPDRWLPRPQGLDLDTPLNFVSTADTYGGNSGSPAVNRALEIVGLNFDRNIEGLTRDFIYLPERGRNIMVDVRAVLEALDDVYDADRIVLELTTGRLHATEREADAARRLP